MLFRSNDTATTEIYTQFDTLSLHDALPISEELAKLLPKCELIREWKTGDALTSARARVGEFLMKHTPR